ncbi:MAG: hypothetical protein ACREQB_05095 [Candidatus Binataceae bacterium]
MRRVARPALERYEAQLRTLGSDRARRAIGMLLGANADFLYSALSRGGVLERYRQSATAQAAGACLASMLIYALSLFARDDFLRDDSELIPLLAAVLNWRPMEVMLRRDALRKALRSQEWLLYTWLVADLGAERPAYDARLEQRVGYQYLSYIEQYRAHLERDLRD